MDTDIQAELNQINELLDSLGNELRKLVTAKTNATTQA